MTPSVGVVGPEPEHTCHRCQKPAKLQCPKCQELSLPKDTSSFCSQECFVAAWGDHKSIHKQVSADAWLYCTKRGKGRSTKQPEFAYTGALRPQPIGPRRAVPDSIPQPDWAESGIPTAEIASKAQRQIPFCRGPELEGIRAACRVAREILDVAHAAVAPGVTTDEIDRVVHEATIMAGGYPSPLNYYSFPKSVCTSVNEIICHGIPDKRPLENGDIVNVDVSVFYKGYHGDLNETYLVGDCDEESKRLVQTTAQALDKAMSICKPGTRFREIGDAVSSVVASAGFGVVRSYCGHGTGTQFHCSPNIPHYANSKVPGIMREGHVFTIEPMINAGSYKDVTWPDGWTSSTADGKRSAQFEHTLVVTSTGCEVLTARLDSSPKLHWE